MKKLLFVSLCLITFSCNIEVVDDDNGSANNGTEIFAGELTSFDSASGSSGSAGPSGAANSPGVITAGEWNDLDHWTFWLSLFSSGEYSKMEHVWGINPKHRYTVNLLDPSNNPMSNVLVTLKSVDGTDLWQARTDNFGKVELFVNPYNNFESIEKENLSISIANSEWTFQHIISHEEGINSFQLDTPAEEIRSAEISFVVDATGSMGDELEYLKTELLDVIERVQSEHPGFYFKTSSVFYRDEGDEYVTKLSEWTPNIDKTVAFIKDQHAGGGGDFPEAVHSGLRNAISDQFWTSSATTKICFLVLDAPPHKDYVVLEEIREIITESARKGIKIIPITASGIDKQTEFLMRFMSILTNGTYVFITDDSGIGNSHLEPTIGEFDVEFLNELMVRLINKYLE